MRDNKAELFFNHRTVAAVVTRACQNEHAAPTGNKKRLPSCQLIVDLVNPALPIVARWRVLLLHGHCNRLHD